MVRRWYLAILIYLILVCLILALRPNMLFDERQYKKWGVKTSKEYSIFSIAILFPVLAFVSFYLASWYIVILS
jgi:hypothetical protein